MWPIFARAFVIHCLYKVLQAMTYTRGAFTVVYPVVRGTGPLFTMLAAGVVFGEVYALAEWAGVAVLVGGILGLAVYNLRHVTLDRDRMVPALGLVVATDALVAAYTTCDAWGIRAAADPFTFLVWFFMIDGVFISVVTWRCGWRLSGAEVLPLLRRGVLGAFLAYFSVGAIMLATRLDTVGEAALLRETSTVFAALIGWPVLNEKVGLARTALMVLIALGAVVMEFAG